MRICDKAQGLVQNSQGPYKHIIIYFIEGRYRRVAVIALKAASPRLPRRLKMPWLRELIAPRTLELHKCARWVLVSRRVIRSGELYWEWPVGVQLVWCKVPGCAYKIFLSLVAAGTWTRHSNQQRALLHAGPEEQRATRPVSLPTIHQRTTVSSFLGSIMASSWTSTWLASCLIYRALIINSFVIFIHALATPSLACISSG